MVVCRHGRYAGGILLGIGSTCIRLFMRRGSFEGRRDVGAVAALCSLYDGGVQGLG